MVWWGWLVIGVLLLGAELFIIEADFFLVFLGVAAIVTGLLGLAVPALPEWAQWLIFCRRWPWSPCSFFASGCTACCAGTSRTWPTTCCCEHLAAARGPARRTAPAASSCAGPPGRPATWVRMPIAPGAKVRIVAVDGITLSVEALN